MDKVRVILVTDGDQMAQEAVEQIAQSLNLRCLSASGGNPTPIGGEEIVSLLKKVSHDPVLVMFDDKGRRDKGEGERALEYVANHPDVTVLGAVAVASNTSGSRGIEVDACVDCDGRITDDSVNKRGDVKSACHHDGEKPVVKGDTVDVLNNVDVPVIIGIGDIGKMAHADDVMQGAPVTRKAIEEILERNGVRYG